jgi:hypothetical protein
MTEQGIEASKLALDFIELQARCKRLESDRELLYEFVRLFAKRVPSSVFYVHKAAKQCLELLDKK